LPNAWKNQRVTSSINNYYIKDVDGCQCPERLPEGGRADRWSPVEMHATRLERIVFVALNFLLVLAAFVLIYYRFAWQES